MIAPAPVITAQPMIEVMSVASSAGNGKTTRSCAKANSAHVAAECMTSLPRQSAVLFSIVQGVHDQRLIRSRVISIDPRRDDVIAFFYMINIAPLCDHDANRFMSQKLGQAMSRTRRALHRV
jgi:hypothetical protein